MCNVGSPYKILAVDGISNIETDFQALNSPYIAGETIINQTDNARRINVKLSVSCQYRKELIDFFKVGTRGRLTVKWTDSPRYVDYIVYPYKTEQSTVSDKVVLNLVLHCPNVYFNDLDDFGENLADKVKLYATPFVWLVGNGLVYDYAKYNREFAVTNTGDVPVGVYVRIKTKEYTLNPQIQLSDSIYVKVLVEMVAGDELEISTVINETQDVFVRFNGENILNRTDQLSTFFQLEVGTQSISYKAEDGGENMQVFLSRRFLYHNV